MTILIVAAVVLIGFLIWLISLSVYLHRSNLHRESQRDWNYDPTTPESEMTPSGDSPYRIRAVNGNVWWNKQELVRVEITSNDGLRLVGHILYSKTPTNKLAFVIHGHKCVSGEMGFIAKIYHNWGFNVFMPDQRSHGKSEGIHIGMGWLERKDMLLWLTKLIEILGNQIEVVIHGISMGASTTMMTCGEKELPHNVKCAIEDCGYTNAYDSFLFHMKLDFKKIPLKKLIISTASVINSLTAHYSFKQASCIKPLQKCKTPMLFIHGTHDLVVPFDMMRELYDSCASEKKMFIVEGARHGVCYFDNTDLYEATVFKFINAYL